jgi:DNA-binding SARP family transcriptional activator
MQPAVAPTPDRRARQAVSLPELVVRVLGPVDVIGAAHTFTRPWALELVTYLAMHPRGATADSWRTALWPDRLPAEPTCHSTVSAARRALGQASDGEEHLPRCRGGRLATGPSVTTDWAQFAALADTGGSHAPDAWRAALDLVRGRPFDGLRVADWVVLEGVDALVQDTVVHVGIRLAELLLATGDGHGAEVALRKALLASPYDERLYRLLLVAADRQGNPAAVDETMAELILLVADGRPSSGRRAARGPGDLLDAVHPQTAALYRSLRRHRGHLERALGTWRPRG